MRIELQNVYGEGCVILTERHRDRGVDGRDAEDGPRRKPDRARDDAPKIVASGPWRSGDEVQDLAVRGWQGFHPAYSPAPEQASDEQTTQYSPVAVATAEEALRLAETFCEDGDRGVREIVAQRKRADRETPADRP